MTDFFAVVTIADMWWTVCFRKQTDIVNALIVHSSIPDTMIFFGKRQREQVIGWKPVLVTGEM